MNAAIPHPQYITDDQGRKIAVILPLEAYTELLEDLSDLAAAADRRDDPRLTHDSLMESLKADGLI